MSSSPIAPPAWQPFFEPKEGTASRWTLAIRAVVVLLVLGGLAVLSQRDFLLFHSLVEVIAIAIAATIFSIGWNVRPFIQNNLLLILAAAYLPIGVLDTLHMLSYRGMGIFSDGTGNQATQLWIAARYVEALSFVFGAACLNRKKLFEMQWLLAGYVALGVLLIGSILWLSVFPDCYFPASGLTAFKKGSEALIAFFFGLSMLLLWQKRTPVDRSTLVLLLISIGTRILSEISFMHYMSVYGLFNAVGHLFKVASLALFYGALIQGSLRRPYEILFRGLSRSEEELREQLAERERAERALKDAKELAEAASRAKGEFLANMSHEIRTPMNAIVGMTELVLETELSGEQREFLSMAKASASSLLGIINDVLDFSKIESGHFDLAAQPFDLRELVQSVCDALALRAHEKGLELVCWVQADCPSRLIGDEGRLRQVLLNLVGNAVKFTDKGEVVVSVGPQPGDQAPGHCALVFSVRDTGCGIAPEKLDKLFRPFSQVDGSMTRRFGGTGLGLVISKQIVCKMGGSIRVQSQLEGGSTFSFEVSLPLSPESHPALCPIEALRGCPALIIEDNRAHRLCLQEMLSQAGLVVASVENGALGLQAVRAARSQGNPYEFILIDCQMPGPDGFAVAEQILAEPGPSHVLLMATTSVAQAQSKQLHMPGLDGYVIKPIHSGALLELLQKLSARPAPSQTDASPSADSPPSAASRDIIPASRRVLLAEDNAVNQKVAVAMLTKRGWTVQAVASGLEAVKALQEGAFDIVLMDVQMPQMDGLEATRMIRQRELQNGGHIPIIGLTAHAMKGDRDRCIAAGMDDYVSKPIDIRELSAAMLACLEKSVSL